MRYLLAVIFLLTAMHVQAEEKVVLQFTIDSESIAQESQGDVREYAREYGSYTNGVLIGINDVAEYDFEKRYHIKFKTFSKDQKNLGVVFTLGQFLGDKLYYIADKYVEIPIGETRRFEFTNKKCHYNITLSTFYGEADLLAK